MQLEYMGTAFPKYGKTSNSTKLDDENVVEIRQTNFDNSRKKILNICKVSDIYAYVY